MTPSRFLTWFQAQQACAASDKDLCTNEQWQAAAAGTWDPGANDGSGGGACHTDGLGVRATGFAGTTPGGSDSCVSVWGAEDMIGNLWEWTAAWTTAGVTWQTSDGQSSQPWPSGYGDDVTWNLGGRATNGSGWTDGAPSAALRGGSWADGEYSGTFSINLDNGPAAWGPSLSFRCCRGR